eukprot:5194619-Pleurochrysis_carterae.AAC.1
MGGGREDGSKGESRKPTHGFVQSSSRSPPLSAGVKGPCERAPGLAEGLPVADVHRPLAEHAPHHHLDGTRVRRGNDANLRRRGAR